MGCKGCGKNKGRRPTAAMVAPAQVLPTGLTSKTDSDYVMIKYNHPSMGQHPVYGAASTNSKKAYYGYRKRGDEFLVQRSDQKSFPNFFEIIPETPQPPKVAVEPPPPPKLVNNAAIRETPTEEPAKSVVELAVESSRFDLDLLPGVTPTIRDGLAGASLNTPDAIIEAGVDGLTKIKYIGAARAKAIHEYVVGRYG